MDTLDIVIQIVGWIYFAAWSISFYPQILINFQRKKVTGLDFNFIALNLTGFLCYTIYNVCLFYIPRFQKDFVHFNPNQTEPVFANDVGFSIHATFATIVTIIQCFIYERGSQTVHISVIIASIIIWSVGGILTLLVALNKLNTFYHGYYFATVKLGISASKYCPQAYFNYKRKSTVGWSIGNILLDFTGGSFSLLQQGLSAIKEGNISVMIGNPVKFGLGLLSMAFDIFFMIQHYVLYTNREEPSEESSRDELYYQADPADLGENNQAHNENNQSHNNA